MFAFVNSVKIGTRHALLFVGVNDFHVGRYNATIWYLMLKDRLFEPCALHRGENHLQTGAMHIQQNLLS
jgi:hypothetical protein